MNFLLSACLLNTADSAWPKKSVVFENRDTELLYMVFQLLNPKIKQKITGSRNPENACGGGGWDTWKGIQCDRNKVTLLTYIFGEWLARQWVGKCALQWLPPSVEQVEIKQAVQLVPLETQMLPRCSRSISITDSYLKGTVDLQCLPLQLRLLDLSGNCIEGPIDLSMLPDFMEILRLESNKIEQDVVQIFNVPETMKRISLGLRRRPEGRFHGCVREYHTRKSDSQRVKAVLNLPKNCGVIRW